MYVADRSGLIAGSQSDLPPFRLFVPKSVDDAVAVLAGEDDAVPYAGGTDLFAAVREGRTIGSLVWLRDIAALRAVERHGDTLSIGAGVTHAEGSRAPETAAIPGLAEAWGRISNPRVLWAATVGGNVMARRTRYEMPILAAALDARLVFATPEGEAVARPEDVWRGAIPDAALLRRIDIPLLPGLRIDYDRSLRPIMTQATAAWRDADGAARARTVIATEYLPPVALDVDPGAGSEAASRALAALPADFADAATGNDYLRRVGAVLLGRQLQRLEPADA